MKFTFLTLCTLLINLSIAQSKMDEKYDKVYIINAEIENIDWDFNASVPSIDKKTLESIQSPSDLLSIIADTPFLSLSLKKQSKKFEKESQDLKAPQVILDKRYSPGEEVPGFGTFLMAFERGEEVIMMIPTQFPEKFKVKWEANGFVINDKLGIFDDCDITEVRIENGTYGKSK